MDRPNERSLHRIPVPRTGGVAIVSGFLLSGWLVHPRAALLAPAALLTAVSLIDDWRGLPVLSRLAVHAAAAAWCISGWMPGTSTAEAAMLVLALVWMANLFNFMDGADGLAGGMAVIGFAFYAFGGWFSGHEELAWTSAMLSTAAIPFLIVNFHPARIFMGDAGSVTLGFLAGALGAKGWQEGAWPICFPLLVFSPFIADATLTLLRRVLSRERFWRPHREHYYQKLVRMGLGHRSTALFESALMIVAGLTAFATLDAPTEVQAAVSATWFVVLVGAAWAIDRRWRQSPVSAAS